MVGVHPRFLARKKKNLGYVPRKNLKTYIYGRSSGFLNP